MIRKFKKWRQIFVPKNEEKASTINLKNFMTQNFQVPDEDLERICEFINRDSELEKIIFDLPDLIQRETPYDKIQIKFYDEFQEDYLRLEANIFTSLDIVTSLKVEDRIEERLYEMYDCNSADKLLIMMG